MDIDELVLLLGQPEKVREYVALAAELTRIGNKPMIKPDLADERTSMHIPLDVIQREINERDLRRVDPKTRNDTTRTNGNLLRPDEGRNVHSNTQREYPMAVDRFDNSADLVVAVLVEMGMGIDQQ